MPDPLTSSSPKNGGESVESVDHEQHENADAIATPLPPRPTIQTFDSKTSISPAATLRLRNETAPSQLRTKPTTAVSLTDIHAGSHQDGQQDAYPPTSSARFSPGVVSVNAKDLRFNLSASASEAGDSASIRSYLPAFDAGGDVESLLGEVLEGSQDGPAWLNLHDLPQFMSSAEASNEDRHIEENFLCEFDSRLAEDGDADENALAEHWKSRLKHFLILSTAGKPIYSRHGDENTISQYFGVIQTIISFYQGANDSLRAFSAGTTRFVVVTEGPLYLVAISRLGESEAQLKVQLDALYMQILSTLTLPTLNQLFTNRPSTDLRRPLQGTEPLLSALADSFTRGSAPTLLSALECLKIRKAHRHVINNCLLKARAPDLLYGLVVAGGRLVSVIRPKRHSLHPSDLQLVFNMLFEVGGVKAAGGENWIPLCLPGFNSSGYLYMYVSFLGQETVEHRETASVSRSEDEVAIILISANKESFYDLQKMRDEVVQQLERNGSMAIIQSAVKAGRPNATEISPGTVIRHFLYKSRANVQFAMPSFSPHFNTLLARRRLLTTYQRIHATVHAKNSHLKVHHCVNRESVSLAWVTPTFELYCVAGSNASKAALAKGASAIIQWARREEERLFILGGAVF
ncbi:MAG: hypothetical protein M1825_001764 [Sarcosagium campestre]|nr:MAG: hypothetical protein M1825_001764 [Sarcosagium campestre]